ncbi:hypothetical protein [Amycolatopsis sp. NPDC003676]
MKKPNVRISDGEQALLAEGKIVCFEPEREPVSLDEIERLSDGWGTAVSEALDWTRGEW